MRALTSRPVLAALVAALIARTAVNGGFRVVYPFLPEIARGLGVSLTVMGLLLALRALVALGAPLVPRLIERIGHRRTMLLALVTSVLGATLMLAAGGVEGVGVGSTPFLLVTASLVVMGAAKPLYDLPMQGWFGARVAHERRGRVLGATELTWGLGLVLAFPAGLLVAGVGWPAMMGPPLLLALGGIAAVLWLLPGDAPRTPARPTPGRMRAVLRRPLVALVVVTALFRFAAELLFVVYGRWLEVDFGLAVAAIGAFTLVVVVAELAGEGAVTAFADRIGLRRSVLLGLLGSAVAYAGLGLVGDSLLGAVVAVVGWFLLFEATITAAIPLAVALGGEVRERLLSLLAAAGVLSAVVAAPLGPVLFALGGIALCGLVAAGSVLLAAGILAREVPATA